MSERTYYPASLTPLEMQFRESMARATQIAALEDRLKVLETQVNTLRDAVTSIGNDIVASMQSLRNDIARIKEIVEEK